IDEVGEILMTLYRKLGLLIAFLALSLLVACSGNNSGGSKAPATDEGSQQAAGESITIRLAHVGSEEHQNQIGSLKFKELIEERSNGAIQVQIFPNGQLGGEGDAVEGIQNGT